MCLAARGARAAAGRVLRGQPFFGTRRQQLSYRVMVMQGMLVAVLFGMSVGVDIFYLVGHLLRQQVVVGASTGFTLVSLDLSNGIGVTGGAVILHARPRSVDAWPKSKDWQPLSWYSRELETNRGRVVFATRVSQGLNAIHILLRQVA